MKRLSFILTSLLLCTFLCGSFTTSAADNAVYYYVNSVKGDDTNSGLSPNAPVKTFTKACNLAKKSGASTVYIVITNEYHISTNVTEVEHSVPFIVTTSNGTTDFAKTNGAKIVFDEARRYYLSGDTTFENIEIDYAGTINFVARYNHITFGEGVTLNCTKKTYAESGAYIVGGWQSPADGVATNLDSHITIKSGNFFNVIGGSRQYSVSDSGGHHYTGTHYIEVSGGNIQTLFGGTFKNHWSGNVDITVSGGDIDVLYTAGDETRRVEGDLNLTLSGGKVNTVNVNNILGDATVNLFGTSIGKMSVFYKSESVANGKKKDAVRTLNYSPLAYTEEELASFEGFDRVVKATSVYASAKGNGDGMSKNSPTSFKNAFDLAAKYGANITILDNITLSSFAEPTHIGAVNIFAENGAKITFSGKYTLGGRTVFDGITLDGITLDGEAVIDASSGKAVISKNCKVNGSFTLLGGADIGTGSFLNITEATSVQVRGGTVGSIIGSKNTVIEVFGGKVNEILSAKGPSDSFAFTISGGEVEKLTLNGVGGKLEINVFGGKVLKCLANGNNARGVARLDGITLSSLGEIAPLFTETSERTFFICDGANGSGRSAADPSSSIIGAYKTLAKSGGTIVIVGKCTFADTILPKTDSEITFTSTHAGVDYAKENAAEIVVSSTVLLSSETEIRNVTLRANGKNAKLIAAGNKLTLGDGITSLPHTDTGKYLSVVGGTTYARKNANTNITINSGKWQNVLAGDDADGSVSLTVNLTVNGGEFVEQIVLGCSGSFSGNINASINGGTFYRGIYATGFDSAANIVDANVYLTINGGTPYASISPAKNMLGTFGGSFNVIINGGNFGHLVSLLGTEGLSGKMHSSVSGNFDFNAEAEGVVEFTNPIRKNGADPWLFYHDGFYYYTATDGHKLGIARAANIGDLEYAEYVTVYTPRAGEMWSKNLWSPEIHYYSDEEIGEGNGGWYCYIACDNGDNLYHRMYVIKCLDGDNLMGRWGNPVTGEVNVPEIITAKDIPDFADTWAAGQTDIRIGGKLYMMYVTETGREKRGDAFYQTENLVEMTNPWTIVGKSSVICYPEYAWEKGGSETGRAPQVVEGGTAVYADDGSIYIIYSGSGYWTTEYQLGQLKYLGGDPLDIGNWEKKPTSILYKSDEINGTGHASYVRDHNGVDWVCYHAYIGKDTSSGRYAFVEPYTADKNGVVIGNGSGIAAPISTVYSSKINPMPLAKKVSGFNAKITTTLKMTVNSFTASVNGKAHALDASPVIRNSRTMLPVRFVAENLGASVLWDDATKTVTLKSDSVTIEIAIGKPHAKVNGNEVMLDSPAFIENSRTYLPVRFVAESLGATVSWDSATSTAIIEK